MAAAGQLAAMAGQYGGVRRLRNGSSIGGL